MPSEPSDDLRWWQGQPDAPSARVSHETIYAAICAQPRGGLKAAMVEALWQRNHRFFPLTELNVAIWRLLDELNMRLMRG